MAEINICPICQGEVMLMGDRLFLKGFGHYIKEEKAVNKTYIVICGIYEDRHNEFVTNDIDEAIEFALLKHDGREGYESFNMLEVWEDGILICEYGAYVYHKVSQTNKLSHAEFKEDLEKFIKD